MMSDPKRQAANAEVLGYSGMHLDSNQYVAEKIRPLLPLYPDNLKKQLWLDQKWWTKQRRGNGRALEQMDAVQGVIQRVAHGVERPVAAADSATRPAV